MEYFLYFIFFFSLFFLAVQSCLVWFLALKDCINSDRDLGTKVVIVIFGYILFPCISTTIYLFVKLFERKKLVIEK